MEMENNLSIYNDKHTVDFYRSKSDMFESEIYLVDKYFPEGARILDIGVGGGRTTAYLSRHSSRYIGVDYSSAMVEACRKRFPDIQFEQANAIDLSRYADASFDAVIFSFNGIDTLPTDKERAQCLREIARVLAPGCYFIFSSHNAGGLIYYPTLNDATFHKIIWRTLRAMFKTMQLATRHLYSGVFSKGEGYIVDPTHGGLDMYVSTPRTMAPQLSAAGFAIEEVVGGHYPKILPDIMQHWFYYAARKIGP